MLTRFRRASMLAVAALGCAAFTAFGSAQAGAVDDAHGSAGFCSDGDGTTVVVDLTNLGGDVLVRCAHGDEKRTGYETLDAAGFEYETTTGSGMTSVCRLEGRPAADEKLDIDGKSGYRESCSDMPPAAAYWSYWKADDGGEWGFSQKGPQAQQDDTDFEAWSFALNSTPEEPAVPALDPVRPAGDSGASGTQNGVEWSGGDEAAQDVASATTDDSGSDTAPWIAGGVIAALAVLIGATVLRRRGRHDSGTPQA